MTSVNQEGNGSWLKHLQKCKWNNGAIQDQETNLPCFHHLNVSIEGKIHTIRQFSMCFFSPSTVFLLTLLHLGHGTLPLATICSCHRSSWLPVGCQRTDTQAIIDTRSLNDDFTIAFSLSAISNPTKYTTR